MCTARQVQLSSSLHTENWAYGYFVANSPDSWECKQFAKLEVLGTTWTTVTTFQREFSFRAWSRLLSPGKIFIRAVAWHTIVASSAYQFFIAEITKYHILQHSLCNFAQCTYSNDAISVVDDASSYLEWIRLWKFRTSLCRSLPHFICINFCQKNMQLVQLPQLVSWCPVWKDLWSAWPWGKPSLVGELERFLPSVEASFFLSRHSRHSRHSRWEADPWNSRPKTKRLFEDLTRLTCPSHKKAPLVLSKKKQGLKETFLKVFISFHHLRLRCLWPSPWLIRSFCTTLIQKSCRMHLKGKLSELEIASNFGTSMNIVKRCKSVNIWCQIEQIELSLRAAASRPGADSTPGETRGKRKSEENVDLWLESCATMWTWANKTKFRDTWVTPEVLQVVSLRGLWILNCDATCTKK